MKQFAVFLVMLVALLAVILTWLFFAINATPADPVVTISPRYTAGTPQPQVIEDTAHYITQEGLLIIHEEAPAEEAD